MSSLLARRPRSSGWFLVGLALILLLPPVLGRDWDSIGTNAAVYVMVAVGLDLMWGLAGQVSLGQQGFMLIGGYAIALGTTKWDLPVLVSLLIALAAAVVVSLVVGAVVLRLQETYLALATLGLGLMLQTIVLAIPYTGRATGIYGVPKLRASFDATDTYRVYWAVALAMVVLGLRIAHSMVGLSWRVTAHNEDLAQSCGVNTMVEKLKAFAMGAALAGIAGGLLASNSRAVSPGAYHLDIVLIVMVGVVVGGRGSIVGAIFGLISVSITLLYAARLGAWTNFIFAAGFVAALKLLPGGIVPSFERWGKAVRSRVGAKAPPAPPQLAKASTPEASKASERPVRHASSEVVLEASGVSKQFGAVTALEDVGLAVHRGEIHGIVGPNGAGKSTLLAIVSGLLRADEGTVTWLGQDVTRLPAWQRARMGMARSFQAAQVVPELTVRENVLLGRYIDHPRGLTRAILGRERARLNAADSSVDEALERLGLTEFADAECDSLPFGQVRLTELARCFVRRPGLLLLDEAAAGLDRADKILLVDQIRRLAAEGTTVCLIEHDTDLVSRACDNVTVLDLGTVLSRGTGAEIFQDSRVRASYMGQRGRAAPEGHGPDGGNGDG